MSFYAHLFWQSSPTLSVYWVSGFIDLYSYSYLSWEIIWMWLASRFTSNATEIGGYCQNLLWVLTFYPIPEEEKWKKLSPRQTCIDSCIPPFTLTEQKFFCLFSIHLLDRWGGILTLSCLCRYYSKCLWINTVAHSCAEQRAFLPALLIIDVSVGLKTPNL